MNKNITIQQAFDHGRALIGFVTGGDPDLEQSEKIILKMAEGGCDLIEIGIPFSDPIAEGDVIQEANLRALGAGTTTDKLFELAANVRKKTDVPMVFRTYINPVYHYGYDRFCSKCEESGINGLIIPDMPYEERKELLPAARAHHVELISMIFPASKQRIRMIASDAEGFVYAASDKGVNGVGDETDLQMEEMIKAVRENTRVPAAAELGTAETGAGTMEQAARLARTADGVIAGSAIVKLVEQYGADAASHIYDYVSSLKGAIS